MPQIDTSTIEGYDAMSPEEKIAALEGFTYEVEEPDLTGYVRKDSLDKATKDAAEWKRKYKAQLTEEEQAKQEREAEFANMKTQLETLQREKNVSAYNARFLEQGYDAKLASASAEALADGNLDDVFANNAKFLSAYRKQLESELLDSTPKPSGEGAGEKIMTKAEFDSASYSDQLAFIAEHPDWKTILK